MTSVPEIARRLIDGVWQTGVAEDGGGGSQAFELIQGNAVMIGDNTFATPLTWDLKLEGDDLLDLTDPGSPTIITAGVYAISVAVEPLEPLTIGGNYLLTFDFDSDGDLPKEMVVSSGAQTASLVPAVSVAMTYYIPAGAVVRALVLSHDGETERNFSIDQAVIQRLS